MWNLSRCIFHPYFTLSSHIFHMVDSSLGLTMCLGMGGRHPSSHLQLPPNSSGRSSGLKYSQSLCSSELLSTTHLALVLGSKKILAIFHITGNTLKSCGKYKWNGRQLGEKMKSANLVYHIRTILCTLILKGRKSKKKKLLKKIVIITITGLKHKHKEKQIHEHQHIELTRLNMSIKVRTPT